MTFFKSKFLMSLFLVSFLMLFSFLASGAIAKKNESTKVLFIGNSITCANNLPGMVTELARFRGKQMKSEHYCPGGYRLSKHAKDPVTIRKINSVTWDFVVLQEQSQVPSYPRDQVEREVYPHLKQLIQIARGVNPKSKVILFMTMADKNGDPDPRPNERKTYFQMQDKINNVYVKMAYDNDALLAPIGKAWFYARTVNPSLELYSDQRHPNIAGSYLCALVLYAVIFNDSPLGLPHPRQINDKTARELQTYAAKAVFVKSIERFYGGIKEKEK